MAASAAPGHRPKRRISADWTSPRQNSSSAGPTISARRGRDLGSRPERAERVDVADLARRRRARSRRAKRSPICERQRTGRRAEASPATIRHGPMPTRRDGRLRQRAPSRRAPSPVSGHPLPEPIARPAERRRRTQPSPPRARPRGRPADRVEAARPASGAAQPRPTPDRRIPATSSAPNARWSRAVWRSIIAIARAWPLAPSSAERTTWARKRQRQDGDHRRRRQEPEGDGQPEADVGAEHQRRRRRSGPTRGRSATTASRCPARVSSPMSRHSLPWRIAATRQPDRDRHDERLDRPRRR